MSQQSPQRLSGKPSANDGSALGGKNAIAIHSAATWLVCSLLFAVLSNAARAGELVGRVTDANRTPVPNAVIALYTVNNVADNASASPPAEAVMDQRGAQFAPHVIVIRRGTAVRFPNSDDIRHQVYSFSAAKRFNLPLYHGVPANPEVFDQAGEVVLGCNIHDKMLGYIYVVDSSWFAKTDASGALHIGDVPAGSYRARLWYPGLTEASAPIETTVTIPATGIAQISFDNAAVEVMAQPLPTSTRSWGERRGGNP